MAFTRNYYCKTRKTYDAYIPWKLEPKSVLPASGKVPWSLFLSRRSSWRDFRLLSSGGNAPTNPFDCKFLREKKKKGAIKNMSRRANRKPHQQSQKCQNLSYIFTMLVKFPSSWGIAPDNLFAPRSNTLRFFNKPISLGMVPIRLFPWRILQK